MVKSSNVEEQTHSIGKMYDIPGMYVFEIQKKELTFWWGTKYDIFN